MLQQDNGVSGATHALMIVANMFSMKQVWDNMIDREIQWIVYHSVLRWMSIIMKLQQSCTKDSS